MKFQGLTGAVLTLLPLSAPAAYAGTFSVSGLYRGNITWPEIITNIVGTLAMSIGFVGGAAFLIGALMYVSGFISEENKSKGKNIMIGSLLGIAIGLSAQVILNSVLFYLYGA